MNSNYRRAATWAGLMVVFNVLLMLSCLASFVVANKYLSLWALPIILLITSAPYLIVLCVSRNLSEDDRAVIRRKLFWPDRAFVITDSEMIGFVVSLGICFVLVASFYWALFMEAESSIDGGPAAGPGMIALLVLPFMYLVPATACVLISRIAKYISRG